MFWLPIMTIYFLRKGFSLTEILALVSIQFAFQIIFEVPSGIFSDFYGRKKTLIISAVMFILGLLMYVFTNEFAPYILASVFIGASQAFLSGSDSSLIYDSLKSLKREDEYKKIEGRAYAFQLAALGTAGFVGGFLTKINISLPLLLHAIAIGVSVLILLSMKEPPQYTTSTERNYFKHLKIAIKFSWNHPRIKWIIIFYSAMMTSMLISHRLFQPYMEGIGIDVSYFGIIYLVWLLFCALVARYAHKIESKIGVFYSLLIISIFASLPLIFAGISPSIYIILILFFSEFAFGFAKPVIYEYINKHVESHNRATILSLNGFFQSMLLVIFSPIIGYLTDTISLNTALIWQGAITFLVGVIFTVIIANSKEDKSQSI